MDTVKYYYDLLAKNVKKQDPNSRGSSRWLTSRCPTPFSFSFCQMGNSNFSLVSDPLPLPLSKTIIILPQASRTSPAEPHRGALVPPGVSLSTPPESVELCEKAGKRLKVFFFFSFCLLRRTAGPAAVQNNSNDKQARLGENPVLLKSWSGYAAALTSLQERGARSWHLLTWVCQPRRLEREFSPGQVCPAPRIQNPPLEWRSWMV